MKPPPPPPIKVSKDKPYCFGGWTWKGGEWTPLFRERLWAKRARKAESKRIFEEQERSLAELDELLDRRL